jgi:hypothetical protein
MKKFFKPGVALVIALIFLVHPVNSQTVFAIPSMQEPLFLLFGLLALLVISRSQTTKSFIGATLLLFLSLLSKETGIVFVLLALLYLGLFHRQKVFAFVKVGIFAALIYILLRAHAVGLLPQAVHAAPISSLSLTGRLLTIPSIVIFYITLFLLPSQLATSYYWTHSSVTLTETILPILVIIAVVIGGVYLGKKIRAKQKANFLVYIFFASWAVLGLLPYLQIIPLDMTACEAWLVTSVPALLAAISIGLTTQLSKNTIRWVYVIAIPIVIVLGIRTAIRGLDYQSQYTLASKDISVSKDNYLAMNNLAQSLIQSNRLDEAGSFALRSVMLYPAVTNYTNLGVVKQKQGDYIGAKQAYEKALQYGSLGITYENLGIVHLIIGSADDNISYFHTALKVYPQNYRLWTYLALAEAEKGARDEAKVAITKAASYGGVPQQLYVAIVNGQAFDINLPGTNRVIHLP